jgi:hypothetical protein
MDKKQIVLGLTYAFGALNLYLFVAAYLMPNREVMFPYSVGIVFISIATLACYRKYASLGVYPSRAHEFLTKFLTLFALLAGTVSIVPAFLYLLLILGAGLNPFGGGPLTR